MQEHDHLLEQLATLNRACGSLLSSGHSAAVHRQLAASLEFLRTEVGEHNQKEEDALFPVIERYVEGPTQMMRAEHRVLRKELKTFERLFHRFETEPDRRTVVKDLVASARTIVQLLVNHIHKENRILFPLVRKFLTKEALREITLLMRDHANAE